MKEQKQYRSGDKVESLVSGLYLGMTGTVVKKIFDPIMIQKRYIVNFFGHNVQMLPEWIKEVKEVENGKDTN